MILKTLEHGLRAALIGLRLVHAQGPLTPQARANAPLSLHGVRT